MNAYGLIVCAMRNNDLEKVTINGMKSAFAHHEERVRIIFEKIKPRYKELRKEHDIPKRTYP